ncbi:uncharacterized protein LOC124539068 [Vanessa cardui]|uniref:uncharacterized protein LOC124539068 n=1 Tax=Vanessa cardui TaxID=171605 RepID=UPI001F140707|nr:uncharacterized protein LOC124539068 [Vanessa cardui]
MDSDKKLIYLVQKYECLFNPKAKNYSDKHSKNNAWEKVSGEMKLTVSECQKQWKKLRDCYKKALRLRQYKSGSARKTEKPIKFEKELEFLKPYLQDRSQTSNLDFSDNSLDIDTEDISIIESQTCDVGESSRSDSALSNHTTKNKPLPLSEKLFRQYVEAKGKEEDPLDAFFLSMSKSVKKMPIRTQAELKRAILGLVTDAEVKLASEESSITPSSMINCYGTQQQQIYSSPSTSTCIPPTTYCPPST